MRATWPQPAGSWLRWSCTLPKERFGSHTQDAGPETRGSAEEASREALLSMFRKLEANKRIEFHFRKILKEDRLRRKAVFSVYVMERG